MKHMKHIKLFENFNSPGNRVTTAFLDEVIDSYLETALFTSDEEEGISGMAIFEFDGEERMKVKEEIEKFIKEVEEEGLLNVTDAGLFGHNFWLTRNGHGAGFWDAGLGEDGEKLSEISKKYGTSDLYVGDDNKPHFS